MYCSDSKGSSNKNCFHINKKICGTLNNSAKIRHLEVWIGGKFSDVPDMGFQPV
jgi:hypothetical protein